MRIVSRGIVNPSVAGGSRAVSAFPSVTCLPDGSLLAAYRVGKSKVDEESAIELRRSTDFGETWSEPWAPFTTALDGVRGSLWVLHTTVVAPDHLIASAMWVDREAYPGKPLFNEETEGCLPMAILLADSRDHGQTWSGWRRVLMSPDVGPPSITSPVLRLASGRLALSIESNKEFLDRSQWFQKVVYLYSDDMGQTWTQPVTVCQDPSGRIFNWDQRTAAAPDGMLASFTWTYDKPANRYLNIQRRLSRDEGLAWTQPEDLGFANQPSRPAFLPDGRVVLAWVDRFGTRSIRARMALSHDAPFLPDSEIIIWESPRPQRETGSTGEMLADMALWSFGLPFAEALPNGEVMVVYYAGGPGAMQIEWVRLGLK
jgi:hypothetical protein